MKIIDRSVSALMDRWLFRGKILILFGARQVGKTTLVKELLKKHAAVGNYFNCEMLSVRDVFRRQDPYALKRFAGDAKFLVFDEAQHIENIGLCLKLFHDTFPDVQVVATGSSSFDLANKINEPLTGRAIEFKLHPFSMMELSAVRDRVELTSSLDFHLRFGFYPEIVDKNENDASLLLDNLAGKYLYKDILEFQNVKKPELLLKLLQLLALQLGNEVSKHELATTLGVSSETIERYLSLLEQTFVIFRLRAFSRNPRKELSKKNKIYFHDIGIRNSLIKRFNPLEFRDDKGPLWENFCIVERMKFLQSVGERPATYFWRTHDKKEVDYIEERDGNLRAFEFKYSPNTKTRNANEFLRAYSGSTLKTITTDTFWDFISNVNRGPTT